MTDTTVDELIAAILGHNDDAKRLDVISPYHGRRHEQINALLDQWEVAR